MNAPTTNRAQNSLIEAARPNLYPRLEFHLRRLNKFFISESIYTVFPACQTYVREEEKRLAAQGRAGGVTVCLIFTFQESEGAIAPATDDELHEEQEAFRRAVHKECASSEGTAATAETSGEDVAPAASPVSRHDTHVSELIGYRPEAFVWKDKSREVFFDFSRHVSAALQRAWAPYPADSKNALPSRDSAVEPGFFLDWCDPATGLPMNTHRGSSSFIDSDAIEQMFPYQSVLVAGAGGGCRMIQHPTFGLCVYPASAVLAFPTDRLHLVKGTLLSLCAP